jgi:chemotaxis protein methyltransferase CheR
LKNPSDHIRQIILAKSAIDISVYDPSFLKKMIEDQIKRNCLKSIEEYALLLDKNEFEVKQLTENLSNSFSLFFRNPFTFSTLEYISLPTMLVELKGKNINELRIWSSACAAGQEVYSLAMLLEELKQNSKIDFKYRIFASDRSEKQIKLAKEGVYKEECLANVSLKRLKKWFKQENNSFLIDKNLQKNIEFSVFDLLNTKTHFPPESIYGAFNLIMCSNILFYYDKTGQELILEKIKKSMAPNACLITGDTERGIVSKSGFQEKFQLSAIYKLKPVKDSEGIIKH